MSLAEKKRHLDEKYPQRTFRYIPKNPYVFGQQAKFVTIGVKVPPSSKIEEVPGPGQYEQKSNIFYQQNPHKIQGKYSSSIETITKDCDFPSLSSFVPRSPITIHENIPQSYITPSDTPGPTFCPQSHTRPMTIGYRSRSRDSTESPGPAAYNVRKMTGEWDSIIFPTFCRNTQRNIWSEQPQTPPPGAYEVTAPIKKTGKWADRLRPSKDRHTSRPYISLRDEIKSMM